MCIRDRYCTRKCQQEDWMAKHASACVQVTDHSASTALGASSKMSENNNLGASSRTSTTNNNNHNNNNADRNNNESHRDQNDQNRNDGRDNNLPENLISEPPSGSRGCCGW
eukprot:TRINITY_DN1473_c0_g1_i1.p1 TRINITY_DN1473_c0_g1~~TRINITY_DN1473_c0_g1_i1.p1  ORF type:complete len:111 (+),score=15.73 TRINITY_DN1473_c0_g1_i1:138-470(+)